jgi:hypothetical protein
MKKLGRKLKLKKETVRELNRNELQDIFGGDATELVDTVCVTINTCPPPTYHTCPEPTKPYFCLTICQCPSGTDRFCCHPTVVC